MSSSLTLTTDEIETHFSTAAAYLALSAITEGLMLGSKTIGANSPTLTAQSKRTPAPGSMIVTRVPMCNTDGFNRSGSGSQEELKSKVAVPSMRNS